MKLESIVNRFRVKGAFVRSQPYGSGHINDTYLVHVREEGVEVPYIFQRINHHVFPEPPLMMENIVRVTRHIRDKLLSDNVPDAQRRVLTVVLTDEDQGYYRDPEGNYWRCYMFIRGARSFDVLQSIDQAYQAGRMFGEFQKMLHDFPGPPLHETIKDFHNGPVRFKTFETILSVDPVNRAASAKPEIEFLLNNQSVFHVLPPLVEAGKIPLRVTHNDTKINNVMLDEVTGEGVCVIDLDTVMPGFSLYDFGDLARTTLSPTDEDEQDLSKIHVDMSRFEAILKGFLSTAGAVLTQTEIDYLVFGCKLITLMIGMRFLADHLNGDTYFKVHRPNHNLDRARSQFQLVKSIIKNEDTMINLLVSMR